MPVRQDCEYTKYQQNMCMYAIGKCRRRINEIYADAGNASHTNKSRTNANEDRTVNILHDDHFLFELTGLAYSILITQSYIRGHQRRSVRSHCCYIFGLSRRWPYRREWTVFQGKSKEN